MTMTQQENRTAKDGGGRSLYIAVDRNNDAHYVSIFGRGEEGFANFIRNNVALTEDLPRIPFVTLLYYEFGQEVTLPAIGRGLNRDYMRRLEPVLDAYGVTARAVVYLHDARYCLEHGIPLLSPDSRPEALARIPEYRQWTERLTDLYLRRQDAAPLLPGRQQPEKRSAGPQPKLKPGL